MGCEQMMQRMTFLLYGDDLWRVKISHEDDGTPVIQIDLHQMTCKEARKTLTNVIAMYRFGFKLDVIHGYNHGTAIRDMIRTDFSNQRIKGMTFSTNQGRTVLEIG